MTVDIPMIGKAQNFEDSNNLETPTSKVNIIKPAAQFQITELNNDNPLIKLSNNSTAPGAVSYTHLDVYKRQQYRRPRVSSGKR